MLLFCLHTYLFTVWFNYLQYEKARLTGVLDPTSSTDGSMNGFDYDGCKQDNKNEGTNGNRVSEIEQLIKGRTFSRYMVFDGLVCFSWRANANSAYFISKLFPRLSM